LISGRQLSSKRQWRFDVGGAAEYCGLRVLFPEKIKQKVLGFVHGLFFKRKWFGLRISRKSIKY
jgi:hypothetical protein